MLGAENEPREAVLILEKNYVEGEREKEAGKRRQGRKEGRKEGSHGHSCASNSRRSDDGFLSRNRREKTNW